MDFSFDWLILLFSTAYDFLMRIAMFFNVVPNDVLSAWGAIGGNGGGFRGDYVQSVLNIFNGSNIELVLPLEGIEHEIWLPIFNLIRNLYFGNLPLWVTILSVVVSIFIIRVLVKMLFDLV